MKTLFRLFIIAATFAVSPVTAQAQTILSNGAPNGQAGYDIFNDFRAADDFAFTGVMSFDLIRFWGLLPTGSLYSPTIFWQILNDGGGTPGTTAIAGGSVAAQPTLRTSLGVVGFDSWQFDLAIGAQSLGPGIYWLALHDGPLNGITDSTLLWETTSIANGSQFAVEFLPTSEWTADWGSDLAFELQDTSVVPEPVTMTLLGTGLAGIAAARARRRRKAPDGEEMS